MSARLCRWFGHSIGKATWRGANRVSIQCARCDETVEMVRR